MARLPLKILETNLIMKNKRKNKLDMLTRLLIYHGFILVLTLQQLFTSNQHLVHAKSLLVHRGLNTIRIRSLDYDDISLYNRDDSLGTSLDEFNSDNHDEQQFISYPMITVNFIPPLVQASIIENSSAIHHNVPIAKIRANITLNLSATPLSIIENSKYNRSQIIQYLTQLSNDYNINNQFQIDYSITNHQNLFAIGHQSGEIFLKSKPGNYTYILDVGVDLNVLPNSTLSYIGSKPYRLETKTPVILEVIDSNDNEPESVKNVLSCNAYDNIDLSTPICTASFKDADRGTNAELTYSMSSDDGGEGETSNLRIDPKTGSIHRRYANVSFNQQDIRAIVTVTDGGSPYLETSIRAAITIMSSNKTIRRGFNEKPRIPDHSKIITLQGYEEPGTSIANLTPLDDDGDIASLHIIAGDPEAIFAIDDGSLIIAKDINFSEKKTLNLTLMATDGADKTYSNLTILIPKIVKSIPNKFFSTSISMSKTNIATKNTKLYDASKYAFDTSFARYWLYSASSNEALEVFTMDENTGFLSLARSINYKFNGYHHLMISIEDTRLSQDQFRSFVSLMVNVGLVGPPPTPPPTTTTSTSTTTTTTTTTTSTTTTTTTTTPRPTTTTAATTTTITLKPTTVKEPPTTPSTTTTTKTTTARPTQTTTSTTAATTSTTYRPYVYHTSAPPLIQPPIFNQNPNHIQNHMPPNQYDPYYPPQILSKYPQWPPPPMSVPSPPIIQPPPSNQIPTYPAPPLISDSQVSVKTLALAVIGIMAMLFLLACACLVCRCCCRSPKSKRYRDANGALLNRSSFHSQQRLHGHHTQHVNGSMSRNMNSRLSLRTAGNATPSSTRGVHSKYGAGDSVSLSAMNERSNKQKALLPPPSPNDNQSSILSHAGDENLYANSFGPGHPQYLNELRRLKPDYSRMSARLPNNKKPTSSTNVNSLRPVDNRNHSKSSSALPSTPVRTSSQVAKGKIVANHRQLPSKGNRSSDLNGSRTTNTSVNVSPSLNDNNSRTILLGSDDINSPSHHQKQSSRHRQRFNKQVHTDSTADYDDVASHSTVDDTTPQTSSENASMSEMPFDARFKTFVKQKKNKESSSKPGDMIASKQYNNLVERYDRRLPPAPAGSEDTDEPSTNLLSDFYADALPVRNGNGSSHRDRQYHDGKLMGRGSSRGTLASGLPSSKTVLQNGTSEMNNNINDFHNDTNDDEEDHGDADGDNEEDEQDEKRDNLRRKRQTAAEQDDESDDSADDEEDEDAEEGVYDLGTSNLFLD